MFVIYIIIDQTNNEGKYLEIPTHCNILRLITIPDRAVEPKSEVLLVSGARLRWALNGWNIPVTIDRKNQCSGKRESLHIDIIYLLYINARLYMLPRNIQAR